MSRLLYYTHTHTVYARRREHWVLLPSEFTIVDVLRLFFSFPPLVSARFDQRFFFYLGGQEKKSDVVFR